MEQLSWYEGSCDESYEGYVIMVKEIHFLALIKLGYLCWSVNTYMCNEQNILYSLETQLVICIFEQ